MRDQILKQINTIIRFCEDTDGAFITDKNGVVLYHLVTLNDYWRSKETVGRHILDLYPELTEETSTILRALRTGKPSYNIRQELSNSKGERVILDATTIPIIVNGQVEGAVDVSKFYVIDQRVFRGGLLDGLSSLDAIITRNPAMNALKRRIRDVAGTDSSVLIYGETGTGKELVAESLHSESARGGRPFVAQNCAAIPSNLLESIFFGTEKGSYTGAVDRKGLFEMADGGTLFLDEINSMAVQLQVKLLKALEEKKVRHLGGSEDIPFNVRLVAAVNEDPLELIQARRMREDLYYRLGVIRLNLPPLRERLCDVALLSEYFVERYNRKFNRKVRGVSDEAVALLEQYSWPGNVRELQNIIEGAFASTHDNLLSVGSIEEILDERAGKWERSGGRRTVRNGTQPIFPEMLPQGFSLSKELDRYEREILHRALEQGGSLSKTARKLGLSRQSLKYKIEKHQL